MDIRTRGAFLCLSDQDEFARVNMIHQNVSFTTWPNEQFNIYLDSACTMTGRFPCNV